MTAAFPMIHALVFFFREELALGAGEYGATHLMPSLLVETVVLAAVEKLGAIPAIGVQAYKG